MRIELTLAECEELMDVLNDIIDWSDEKVYNTQILSQILSKLHSEV